MSGKLKGFLKQIEPWQVLLALVATIVGTILGAHAWVRNVAQDAILDEKFLSTLAARVRPTCIFDSRGAIETDLGVSDYIQDLKVTANPTNYTFTIEVEAKRHLAYPPLITAVDVDLYTVSATRGKMHSWTIVLSPNSVVQQLWGDAALDTNAVHRFKLEILH